MTDGESRLTAAISRWKEIKDDARESAKEFRQRIEEAEDEVLRISNEVRLGQKTIFAEER